MKKSCESVSHSEVPVDVTDWQEDKLSTVCPFKFLHPWKLKPCLSILLTDDIVDLTDFFLFERTYNQLI